MKEKKKFGSRLYPLIEWLVWLFTPKFHIEGEENLPEDGSVIICNHCHMYGPITGVIYTPGKHVVWCIGEMMNKEEVADYAYQDFWSKKPKWIRWFYRILSYLIVPISVVIFNNAGTIPVYHDSRLLTTFRESLKKLQKGYRVVIFPECYDEYNHIVHQFQEGFVELGQLYYRRTKKPLAFVPTYLAPKLRTIYYGEPIYFNPEAPLKEEEARITKALMDAITEKAESLPEHTVIPYPNISKKYYTKNHVS
ncbi:MAG: 1-acyl-sn-glycerol-3-phosphate acyltransferase [Lachnospiraceae bacterium]|nr:1-acyl-sn-glycerol-3-phosphate acyltransferase [Lachnospiraceae bacterium]